MHIPESRRRLPNARLMLAHCIRRWPNINPALGKRFVFAGVMCILSCDYEITQMAVNSRVEWGTIWW